MNFNTSLTNKEQKLLQIIFRESTKSRKSPSFSKLAEEMDYKSKRSISILIDGLVEKNYLAKDKSGKYRIIKVIPSGNCLDTVEVKLVGSVPCGQPLFAEENIKAKIAISTSIATSGNDYFLLRAIGNSMNDAPLGKKSIDEGDLVLIKRQSSADNGDWVVALIDDKATIKEFRRNKKYISLVPRSNDESHNPIIVEDDTLIIQGVVKDVLKGVNDLISEFLD